MLTLDINTSAASNYAAQLEQMSRSALPVTVRQTLNAAAFEVKKVHIKKRTDIFVKRKPTFFSATSTVDTAKGFDINTMASQVGFFVPTGIKSSGHAVQDLEQQEKGGYIDKRAFVPLVSARVGNRNKGNVREQFQMEKIKNKIINSNDEKGSAGERWNKAAIAAGVGGFVIGSKKTKRSGSKLLWQIKKIDRYPVINPKGGTTMYTFVKAIPIYSVKAKRKVNIKTATHFMQKASQDAAVNMYEVFKKYAEKNLQPRQPATPTA